MRPATNPAPPLELEKIGSRSRGSSESYGRLVTSFHERPATGSAINDAKAALYAPGATMPGAVRACRICSAALAASSVSSPGSPTLVKARGPRSRSWLRAWSAAATQPAAMTSADPDATSLPLMLPLLELSCGYGRLGEGGRSCQPGLTPPGRAATRHSPACVLSSAVE